MILTVAVCAGVGFGLPTVRTEGSYPILLASAGACVTAVVSVRRILEDVPPRRARWSFAGAGIVIVVFGLGASTQLVLDGRPQLATSAEARAHRLIGDLSDDLLELTAADVLIAYEQADARARYNDYEPAIADLRSIANRWSRTDLGSLPDPDLIDVVQGVKVAATFGAEALEIRFRIITEPDERSEQAMAENRAALFETTLAAAAALKPLAERYQVDITTGLRGE